MAVPSFTSSSNGRLPDTPVWRLWFLVVVCFGLFLVAIEVVARAQGYEPMVNDTKELWCYHRDRVSKAGKNSLVLVGASRMQNDIVPEELSSQIPDTEVAMLALSGHDSMAMLESLANDEKFTGTVVWSSTILWMKGEYFAQTMTRFIEFYENEWSWRMHLSTEVQILMQEHLAILHEGFSFEALKARLFGLQYENLSFARASRFREVHWARTEDILSKKTRANKIYADSFEQSPFPSPEAMSQHYSRVEQTIQKLIRKGCRVVVLRLPSSGKVWELEQQYTPKEFYWDRFAQQTAAETYHFKDYVSLSGFECSDNTHLDYSDAILFTRAFAELLLEGGDISDHQP